MGTEFCLGWREGLEIDGVDGCTTQRMCLMPWSTLIVYFQMFKRVNFMLHALKSGGENRSAEPWEKNPEDRNPRGRVRGQNDVYPWPTLRRMVHPPNTGVEAQAFSSNRAHSKEYSLWIGNETFPSSWLTPFQPSWSKDSAGTGRCKVHHLLKNPEPGANFIYSASPLTFIEHLLYTKPRACH